MINEQTIKTNAAAKKAKEFDNSGRKKIEDNLKSKAKELAKIRAETKVAVEENKVLLEGYQLQMKVETQQFEDVEVANKNRMRTLESSVPLEELKQKAKRWSGDKTCQQLITAEISFDIIDLKQDNLDRINREKVLALQQKEEDIEVQDD